MSFKHVPLVTRLLHLSDPRHCTDGSFRLFNRGLLGSCSFSIPFPLFLFFLPLALHFLCQVTLQEAPPMLMTHGCTLTGPRIFPDASPLPLGGPTATIGGSHFTPSPTFLIYFWRRLSPSELSRCSRAVSGALSWRGEAHALAHCEPSDAGSMGSSCAVGFPCFRVKESF